MDDIVVINNLTKRFSQITALDNFSIKLPKGKVIGMLGPNGSGKTTLIKILTNLSMRYEGEVLINGQKPGIETKKIVSYLPDCNFLSDSWTVNNAIEYFVDFFADFDEQKARNLIAQLGINFNQKIKTLSKGTKEKVHLVLVLSRNAELYIFDEPIAGVDPAARDLIFKLILENYNKNGTILMATHLILEAEAIFDYAFFINNGRLALYDSVENIKNKTGKTLDQLFREIYRYG
ncbi:MAG: ABC transporter ATP-binding protein [Bacilli bacterium]|mgnify:FL=1|jgi:ABC transporter related protein|nr:ABC transporter ATP-binding protein [Staphylococcus sp.]